MWRYTRTRHLLFCAAILFLEYRTNGSPEGKAYVYCHCICIGLIIQELSQRSNSSECLARSLLPKPYWRVLQELWELHCVFGSAIDSSTLRLWHWHFLVICFPWQARGASSSYCQTRGTSPSPAVVHVLSVIVVCGVVECQRCISSQGCCVCFCRKLFNIL